MQKLLTVPEVADELQVKPSTIYTWVRQGQIPHVRIGRLIRFSFEQIEKFLHRDDRAEPSAPERRTLKHDLQDEKEGKE